MRRILSRSAVALVVLIMSCTADGGPIGLDDDLLVAAGAGTPPVVILLGTSGGIATFQATWTGVAPFAWDARPNNKSNSPKQFADPYGTTSTTFTMTQQSFAYDGVFKAWEKLAGGGFSLLGATPWTVPALAAAPDAMDDAYGVPMGGTLNKGASSGALSNDNLGSPLATLTSFGGGSLGGTVTDNAPGASVALAGGTLTVGSDGSLTLANPTTPGTYTFLYRLTNTAGTDDATVTIDVLSAPTVVLVGTGGGQAMFQATWSGTAPFSWDARPVTTANSPKSFNPTETNTTAVFSMTQQAFTYPANFKVWEKLGGGAFNLLGNVPFTVPAIVPSTPPTATADGPYDVDDGASLNVGAGAGPPDGLLVNDALGTPAATLTSFGGGSLGGAVTDNAAGASVALAGGTLTVNGDGSFDLVTPTVVGTYTFMYRITNTAGTSDATVTINVNSVGAAPTATADGPYDVDDGASLNVGAGAGPPDGLMVNDALGTPAATLTSFGGGSLGGVVTDNAAGASVALAGGTLTVNGDGSFDLVTPTVVGTYTFMYRITNTAGTSDATVTINVNSVGAAPTATADGPYDVDDGASLNVGAGAGPPDGLMVNDALGTPAATLTSFGGGSLGGVVTDNAAGASVALAGGTLTVNGDGSFDLVTPTVVGTYTFMYRLTNVAGTSDATVTINVNAVGAAPTATADGPYDVDENATLNVGAGAGPPDGLMVNDALGTPAATLTSFGGGSLGGVVTDNAAGASVALAGGTLTVNSDGSFDLVTPTVVGTYTFMYRLTNVAGTSDATVTINVNAVVPPVTATDDNYTATGNIGIEVPDGGSDVLANDLGTGLTVTQVMGSGTNVGVPTPTTAGGSVTLLADGSFTYDPPAGLEGGDDFTYQMTDGVTTDDGSVMVTMSGMIWFIDNSATGADAGSFSDPFQTLASFNAANVSGGGTDPKDNHTVSIATGFFTEADGINLRNGQVLIGSRVQLDNFFVADPLSSTAYQTYAGAAGMSLAITTGGGNGIDLASGNTIRGLDIGNTTSSGFGLNGAAVGTLTIADVGVSGSGGALNITGGGILSATFDDLSSSSSSAHGINLDGVSGSMTVTAAGGVIGSTLEAVRIANAPLPITFAYPGDINNSTQGIEIIGNFGGGTVSFSGTLTLNTTSNDAFFAAGGAAVTATGAGSTLTTTSGRALIVDNTTIGAAGLTFQSVSASGGINRSGIVLNATGGQGGLTVTGDGSSSFGGNGSGGTIANMTGANGVAPNGNGIWLNNTSGVSLKNMQLNDFENFAILGTNVTGFTLANSTISGTNGNSAADDEGSISFANLLGSARVTGSNISGGLEDNIVVTNTSGTLDRLTVDGNIIGLNSTAFGNDGILVESRNSAVLNLSVLQSTFLGARGDHVQCNALQTSTMDCTIQDNAFSNAHTNSLGGGVTISGGSGGGNINVTYDISGTAVAQTFQGSEGNAITANFVNGAGTVVGNIDNNKIGVSGVGSSGSASGSGIAIGSNATVVHTTTVNNNDIDQIGGFAGIDINASGSAPVINATVTNNTINEFTGFAFAGINTMSGGGGDTDQASVCVDARTNTIDASATFGLDVFIDQINFPGTSQSSYRFPGYGGAATPSGALITFLSAQNTLVQGAFGSDDSSARNVSGTGTSCP